ncbi:Thiol:disulfide interchange protein DsbD OS=Eoetvoesiella caeni OX=645616 GN=dsbD PE=3 SV=1 [Eoetvoesiella caeni]
MSDLAAGGVGTQSARTRFMQFDPVSPFWSRLIRVLLVAVLLALALLQAGTAKAEDEFLDPKVAFVFSAAMAAPDRVDIHFKIAPGYYMYRERFEFALAPDSSKLGQPVYPRGTVKHDPTFGKDMEVYHRQVTVSIPLAAGAALPQTLSITGQGCADAGLCYPPMTTQVRLTPAPQGYQLSGQGVVASVPAPIDESAQQAVASPAQPQGVLAMDDMGLASFFADAGWLQVVGLCLLLGVLLTFTPCVLPMAPIVLAVVAGDARQRSVASRGRGLALAAVYVLGVSVVYTVLGVVAGLAGASLAAWLQTPLVLSIFAVLLALLALSMFDVFTLQAPVGVQSALNDKMARIPGGRFGGAFLMGMLSALIVGPCVAAPLAGVLLFISQTGDVVLGGSALFAMAWGQGLLLLILGASSGALLPKAGPWMEGVKRVFGMLLLATAWWMVSPILPAAVTIIGWALLALCAAVLMGAFGSWAQVQGQASSARQLAMAVWRTLGLMLALAAALQVIGLAAGGRDVLRPLAPFASSGLVAGASAAPAGKTQFTQVRSVQELDALLASATRPVMLDFYADWCVSCIEMERFTFSDPAVAAQMAQMTLVQADVTKNTPEDQALLKRFKLFGPPGIMFFDSNGRQLENRRVIGFKNARDFGAVLQQVLAGPPA